MLWWGLLLLSYGCCLCSCNTDFGNWHLGGSGSPKTINHKQTYLWYWHERRKKIDKHHTHAYMYIIVYTIIHIAYLYPKPFNWLPALQVSWAHPHQGLQEHVWYPKPRVASAHITKMPAVYQWSWNEQWQKHLWFGSAGSKEELVLINPWMGHLAFGMS